MKKYLSLSFLIWLILTCISVEIFANPLETPCVGMQLGAGPLPPACIPCDDNNIWPVKEEECAKCPNRFFVRDGLSACFNGLP